MFGGRWNEGESEANINVCWEAGERNARHSRPARRRSVGLFSVEGAPVADRENIAVELQLYCASFERVVQLATAAALVQPPLQSIVHVAF